MQTVSGSSAAAALASVGNALSSPARPASFKKSRRVQELYRGDIKATLVFAKMIAAHPLSFQRKNRRAIATRSGGLGTRRNPNATAAAFAKATASQGEAVGP